MKPAEIRQARIDAGLTQQATADLLGDEYRNVGRFSLADGSYPSHDAAVTAIDNAYQELIRAEERAAC